MLRRTLAGLGLVLAIGFSPSAQGQPSTAQEREAAAQARAQAQEKEREKEAAERERQAQRARAEEQERREREAGQPVNIRIELTIRDQRGATQPDTKTVSLVTADRSPSRIRTGGNVRTEKFGVQDVRLNVDARPTLIRDGRLRLFMTFEYRPADTETSPSNNISEMIECVLVPDQPLIVSKSADPNSDRSVTVEVKATILK
jgi:hypothetical protein